MTKPLSLLGEPSILWFYYIVLFIFTSDPSRAIFLSLLLWTDYLGWLLLKKLDFSILEKRKKSRDDVFQECRILRRRRDILGGNEKRHSKLCAYFHFELTQQSQKKSFLFLQNMNFFQSMLVPAWGFMCTTTCIQVSNEATRKHRSPWNWSYKSLWARTKPRPVFCKSCIHC